MIPVSFPAYGIPTADLIRDYRKAAAQVRRLNATGNTSTATLNAHDRHATVLRHIERTLCATGRREFAGTLTQEAKLLARIAEGRRNGQPRPELVARKRLLSHSLADAAAA